MENEKLLKRLAAGLLGIFMLLTAPGCVAEEAEEKPLLIYFFENYCGSCHPETAFHEEFGDLTAGKLSDYKYEYHNVVDNASRDYFKQVMDEYGVPEDERALPTVVVDGKVYSGDRKIQEAMPADFIENTSTDSLIYYMFSPACGECAKAEAILEALPESITAKRGKYSFESKIVIENINIYENAGLAQALFEHYNVPEDKRVTPIVFLNGRYYNGAERIERMLQFALEQGYAVGTPIVSAKSADFSGLTVAGSLTAGLVAGFNPCALSMLLFFLGILLSSGRASGKYAAAYLLTKLVAYMLIGTVLVTALSAWNPTWLPLAAKLLLTGIGGVMAVLNIMDAISALNEKYGRIKNQLPQKLRGFLHTRIRAGLEGKNGWLMPTVIALGAVVAVSEFMCSGQLYLATLTASLEAGLAYRQNLLLLAVFCLAFILPSAVLATAIVKGQNSNRVSMGLLKGMPGIKIATALVMIAIIVIAWVL